MAFDKKARFSAGGSKTKRLLDCWLFQKGWFSRLVVGTPPVPYISAKKLSFFFAWRKDPQCYSPESQRCPKIIGLILLICLFQWSFLGSLGTAGNMKIMFASSYFRSVTQERLGSKTFWAKSEQLNGYMQTMDWLQKQQTVQTFGAKKGKNESPQSKNPRKKKYSLQILEKTQKLHPNLFGWEIF